MKEGIISLIVAVLCLLALIEFSREDKYIMRDECVFHETREWTGDGISVNYTPVTCDTAKFYKYHIEP